MTDTPEGTRRIYRLADKGVVEIEAYIRGIWGDASTRFAMLAENTQEPS